jgi:uncharacterized iron-regulated membrane protein
MRTIHRILAIITVAVMLYLGVTGTLMQLLDLYTLSVHAPETDPGVASINEGRYGNGSIQVISDADLTAQPLPANLDYGQAFSAVLQDMHKAAPAAAPRFVELRQVDGRTVGQVDLGPLKKPPGAPPAQPRPGGPRGPQRDVRAFDLQTGAPVKPTSVRQLSLPRSFREDLKELHRFWSRRDVPGVWYELGCGIILWGLIVTGLWQYFQLLSARAKIGRKQWFWMSGGTWKALHRVISVAAAVFIMVVAFTGTWLGFESVWHTFAAPKGPEADVTQPLSDAQVQQMAVATLADFRRLEPQTPIKTLRVRHWGGMNQGGVVTGGAQTRQILFNTGTGKVAKLTEPGYPVSGFPWGTETHENIKHLHAGFMFGLPTRMVNLIAGLSLIYLSVSGVVMYVELWLKRRKNGLISLVWV